jgi:tRNA-binding protein
MEIKPQISWSDFEKIDIRCGTIIEATEFDKARKPAYKLRVDFGPLGIKNSSAQITTLYRPDELIGKQVLAIVNFQVKQIANYYSECLVMGIYGEGSEVILIGPERKVANGSILG